MKIGSFSPCIVKQVVNSRPYKGMQHVGIKIRNLAIKIYNLVLPKNPITEKRQIRLIPTAVERLVGKVSYDSVCPKEQMCTNATWNTQVSTVFDNLVAQVQRKNITYQVRVLHDDDTTNAYCLPGGFTVITTAMIQALEEPSDFDREFPDITFEDKIAAVMGHEIIHAAAGHGAMKMQLKILTFCAGKITSTVLPHLLFKRRATQDDNTCPQTKVNKHAKEALGKGIDVACSLASHLFIQSHSRCNEFEADKYGMLLAHSAGYNPLASVWLQKKFVAMEKGESGGKASLVKKGIQLFSSHPPSETRVHANRKTLQEIQSGTLKLHYA